MGLFKNLVSSLVDGLKEAEDQMQKRSEQTSAPKPTPQHTPTAETHEIERTEAEWNDYFREILKTEFPQYAVQENVPVQDMVGAANDEFQLYATRSRQAYKAEWGKPYSFVLSQNGQAKGVVMLGSGHSHDSNVKYLIARMYAKKLGIPYINFYTQMPNEKGYVIERIRKFLN